MMRAVIRPAWVCARPSRVRVAAFIAGTSASVALNASTASCNAANPSGAAPPRTAGTVDDLRGYLVRNYGSLVQGWGWFGRGAAEESRERSSLKSIKSERPSLLRCQGGEVELHADYEMLGVLGRGGFGTVRKARDRTTGLFRAIKAVQCEEGAGEAQWERLFGEVEALMAMSPHPNIVRLHGYYRGKDTLYLVEEFCSGGTFEARLKQRGGRRATLRARGLQPSVLRGCSPVSPGAPRRQLWFNPPPPPYRFVQAAGHGGGGRVAAHAALGALLPRPRPLAPRPQARQLRLRLHTGHGRAQAHRLRPQRAPRPQPRPDLSFSLSARLTLTSP